MDDIGIFNLNTVIDDIQKYKHNEYNVSKGIIQKNDGKLIRVNGRTIKVIAEMESQNIFNDAIVKSNILSSKKIIPTFNEDYTINDPYIIEIPG